MKHFALLFFFFYILGAPLFAQHYNFKEISVEQGLPRSGAYSLLEDSKGFLWITLDGGGVARYDGKNFKNFDLSNGLPSRKVRAIYEDSKQNIWFGTTQGLCLYKNNRIKTFTIEDGLSHNYIRAISEDKRGNIIIGTNKGVNKYDHKNFTILNSDLDTIFSLKTRVIYKSKDSQIWIGTEKGLFKLKNNQIIKSDFDSLLTNKTVLSILKDSKNNMWIGTEEGVIYHNKDTSLIYNQEKGLISNRIRAICEDNSNNIWLGTRTGISCITKTEIKNINKENGLTHERIRDILLDKNGTLWFTTYYGGINNFNPKDFISYSTTEGLVSNQILSINQSSTNHNIIAGTFDGVSTFELNKGAINTIKNYTTFNGLPHNRVFNIFEDNHNFIWLGTKKGIAITKGFKKFQLITAPSTDIQGEIYSIEQENDNTFWAGGEDGLFQITFSSYPRKYTVLQYNNENIPSTDISTIAKDNDNNIWIGYRHDGIRIKKSKVDGFITPNFSQPIENISTMVIEDNNIWVGSDTKGLFYFKSDQMDDTIQVKQYSTKDGLSSNNVYSIAIKSPNEIWIGSEKGVDKIQLNNSLEIRSIQNFGKNEGINGGEVIEKSTFITSSNNLLVGTVKGLACTSPLTYNTQTNPPKITLLKFESFNKDKHQKENHINNLNNINIEYSSNNISLDFIGIDLSNPKNVKYKWFLDGFSKNWSLPTKRSYLNFTNLPDGKYTLKIISANSYNIWNQKPLTIPFHIKTPFWKSFWFYITLFLILIIAIYKTIKWKINQLKKQQQLLEKKIQDATQIIKEEKLRVEFKNNQIYLQKEQLEEQHKEIKQSIDYAQLIQEASLPSKKITNLFPNSFLFYQPRDIVSGDFYWWEEKDDLILFCVADSTGHGIPGAFISLIGTILYNEIFYSKQLLFPNKILDELNKSLQITLNQHSINPKIKDGMDLSFCCYNKNTKKLYFSGANNPLWLVRHNENKLNQNNKILEPKFINLTNSSNLFEIKGDKQPIGLHAVKQHPFTLHEIEIQEGDEIYLFTDGYADQFGGEKNKKFMSKRFKHLLTSNQHISMKKAQTLIDLNFTTWKGHNAQVDDVCVVGIRF